MTDVSRQTMTVGTNMHNDEPNNVENQASLFVDPITCIMFGVITLTPGEECEGNAFGSVCL